jgi:G protein-coupled receptor GPR1
MLTSLSSLIMLLILSDLTKTLWLVVFPIYDMVNGPVQSDSPLCQASGFFLTLGIEASDVAVLLIALHTGLYIFRGGSGLYPYRRYAYIGFVVTPLLLTFLAFLNSPAFVNSGEFCYLPTKPSWARQALSWVPRYIIFVAILVAYGYIYIHVTGLMNKYGAVSKSDEDDVRPVGRRCLGRRTTGSLPPTPEIAYHGLIPSTPFSDMENDRRTNRQDSVSTFSSVYLPERSTTQEIEWDDGHMASMGGGGINWQMPNFNHPRASTLPGEAGEPDPKTLMPDSTAETTKLPPHAFVGPAGPSPSPSFSIAKTTQGSRLDWFWNKSFAPSTAVRSRSTSLPNIFAMLLNGPRSSISSSSTLVRPAYLGSTGMAKTRIKIRRQLRQLFIYPLVYLAVWLVPFVSHIKRMESDQTPTVLAMVSLLSLCVQGIANALVFSIREKPWRHSRRRHDGYHATFWSRYNKLEGVNPNVGRTREEMLVDGKIARRRRDQETEERRLRRLSRPRTTRDWWEHLQESVNDLDELNDLIERAT